MRAMILAAAAAAAAALAGCASSLVVKPLRNDAPAGSKVDGIPIRMPVTYTAKLYMLDGAEYKPLAITGDTSVTIGDPNQLYVIGFKGLPLATHTVEVSLNDNGTVEHVNAGSTSTGQDALTQLGASALSVATQLNANRMAANQLQDAYGAAKVDYYTKLADYCAASAAIPLDLSVVKLKAAALNGSEQLLMRAHQDAKSAEALPFGAVVNPETDVGVGCPPPPIPVPAVPSAG